METTNQKKNRTDVLEHPVNDSGLYQLFSWDYDNKKWDRLAQGPKESMLWAVKLSLSLIVKYAGMPSTYEEFLALYASYLVLSPENEIVPIKWHEIKPVEGSPPDPSFWKILEHLDKLIPPDTTIRYEGRL
jgi:hypothetical protein